MPDEFTTIRITMKTKEKFDKLGNISMSQDDLLNSLMDFWNKYRDVIKK